MLFKRNLHPLLLLILVVMIFIGCKKDIELPHPQLQQLFGEWEWIQSMPGDGGPFISPTSTGNTVNIEFNKNGIFRKYVNNKLKEKRRFTLHEDTDLSFQPAFYIEYQNEDKALIEIRQNDTLLLHHYYHCFHCGTEMYVRK